MGDNAGDWLKVAIPVAIGAGAIIASGGTATPAVVGGIGAAEGAGAAGAAGGMGAGLGLAETGGMLGFGEGLSLGAAGEGAGAASGWGMSGLGGMSPLSLNGAGTGGVGSIVPAGLTPIEGGFAVPQLGATNPGGGFNFNQALNRGTMGLLGGNLLSSTLGLNQPKTPFQMPSAQAPSPVSGGGGRFQPTSDSSMAMLANKMAQRQAQQRGIRFA